MQNGYFFISQKHSKYHFGFLGFALWLGLGGRPGAWVLSADWTVSLCFCDFVAAFRSNFCYWLTSVDTQLE